MSVTINGSNTPTAGGVTYGDGTNYATTAAGTSGQVLLSAGSSAPTWGTPASATTATNLTGGSAGTVPYQSASGTTQMLAAGTSGQVLTSSGAGAPSWTTPSAGAMVLISTTTASGASAVTFSGLSGYNNYRVLISNLFNSDNNTTLELRFGTPTLITSGYTFSQIYLDSVDVQKWYNATSQSRIYLISSAISNASGFGVAGSIDVFDMTSGSYTKASSNLGYYFGTGPAWTFNQCYGVSTDTTAKTAISIYPSSGTFSGKISLYGISS